MRDEYRDVTLEDLLHHRGGIHPYTMVGEQDEARLAALEGSETEIRAGFALEVLGKEPVGPRGQFEYSNAGYAMAALMVEQATGKTWSDLVREHVFTPAGVERADFGWPATPERPDQPRGHFLEGDTLRVQGLEEYPLGDYIDPAGDVCMSIADLARYARLHLRGLAGHDGTLQASSVAWLHADPEPGAMTRYAAGWVIRDDPDMGEVHWHNGSAGTFYAAVAIYPQHNRAVVAVSNGGLQRGQAAVGRVIELLAKGGE
jgi:CubicO group peptidase (beta-lactamase class C family)